MTDKPYTIIDLGTGSGCIAISIAKNLTQAKVFALDISPQALKVAEKNSKFHRVQNRVLFLESDLLSVILGTERTPESGSWTSQDDKRMTIRPDIIVANLPYIPTPRLLLIDPMVKDFEPKLALDGGIDGFELYRRLFSQMNEYKMYPKVLIAEIDEEQGQLALSEVKKYFPNAKAEIKKDLAKRDRILVIYFT